MSSKKMKVMDANSSIPTCPKPESGLMSSMKASKPMGSDLTRFNATQNATPKLWMQLSKVLISRSRRMLNKAAEPYCSASMLDVVLILQMVVLKPS